MTPSSLTDQSVAKLRTIARRVGDGRPASCPEFPRTRGGNSQEAEWLADVLGELLVDRDVNVRIGAANLIRERAVALRETLLLPSLVRLDAALKRACEDESLNDYVYGGSQLDETDIRTVAEEARSALRAVQPVC